MSPSTELVLHSALELPLDEQIELIEALVASLDEKEPAPLDEQWLAEIQRRSAEIDAGKVKPVPWSAVREEIRKHAGEAAGRNGSTASPQNSTEDRGHREHDEDQNRQRVVKRPPVLLPALVLRGGWRKRLTVDHANDAIDAGIDAAVEVALLEERRDDFVDDAFRRGVRQRAFQAVAGGDPQLPIVLRDQEQHAIVD